MEKELMNIHDFVQSLERTQLSGEQQSLFFATGMEENSLDATNDKRA